MYKIDMLIWIEQLQKFYLSVEDSGLFFFFVFPTAEIYMYKAGLLLTLSYFGSLEKEL